MHRHEDQAAPTIVRGPEVRPRARVDRDQSREVLGVETREPHDLHEVLGEVAEGAPRNARDLAVPGREREDDGEVLLRDLPPPDPEEVCHLATDDGGGIRDPRWETLSEGRSESPGPERRSVEQTIQHARSRIRRASADPNGP